MWASMDAPKVMDVACPLFSLIMSFQLACASNFSVHGGSWGRFSHASCIFSNDFKRSPRRASLCPRLFAVNHALAAASELKIARPILWDVEAFEENALTAGLGDAPENLVQPGGSNYDWSVLHCNLQIAGLASHPLPPAALEPLMMAPFATHYSEGFSYAPVAYILRTPQCDGHWIALLPPGALGLDASEAATAVLCDSLQAVPYVLTLTETEHLLTACALEGMRADAGFGHDISWGAFLITGPAMPAL